jgi:hypothetical protein
LIGGLVARMMGGYEFAVPCDCFELSFEVVERSTVSFVSSNFFTSFTSLEETVSGFLGGGFAFVTISVAPLTLLISCFLPKSGVLVGLPGAAVPKRHKQIRPSVICRTDIVAPTSTLEPSL